MIKTSIHKLAEEIGFDIANTDDETQAKLINGFCRGIHDSMRESNRETQICYMAQHITPKALEVLKAIVEFVEIKEEKK